MKHLHLNNHISSKQDVKAFAQKLFNAIIEHGEREIILSIDDGDSDVWKYELHVYSEQTPAICQITEN